MNYTISPISVEQFRLESPGLLKEHYDELTKDKEVIRLAPAWDKYYTLERTGHLLALAARDDEGWLVGYAVFTVGNPLHYTLNTTATNDVLFLRQEHRKGSLGLRLIREAEAALKTYGVQKVLWRAKLGTPLHKLLEHLRYDPEELVVSKLL